MKIKVLIADDHRLFREGLIGLLETREDTFTVVGEASTGKEAVLLARQLEPDIVLMDILMPEGDGLQALRQIKEHFPHVQVVMLTSSENSEHLYQAVQYGAAGYLLKNLDAKQFFDFIKGVMNNEAAMTREMASRLLKGVAKRSTDPSRGEEALTERELDVLRLVATGASNQEIADKLFISINTAKRHIRSILEKLQLQNRTQAANYAIQRGLISPFDPKTNP